MAEVKTLSPLELRRSADELTTPRALVVLCMVIARWTRYGRAQMSWAIQRSPPWAS
jgi:hypothetical protein